MNYFKPLFLLLFCFPVAIFSQEKNNDKKEKKEPVNVDLFFNEFSASINLTTVANGNTENKVGGGVGIYKVWRNDKLFNIVHGFEYNYSSQFKEKVYEGSSYAYYKDVSFKMHNISIPLMGRFTFGDRTKLFVEGGGFMEFALGAKRQGSFVTTNLDGSPNEILVDEEANLKYFNYGFSFGIGTRIPVKGIDVLLKIDYKFGVPDLYTYEEKIYNRYMRFSIGINLR